MVIGCDPEMTQFNIDEKGQVLSTGCSHRHQKPMRWVFNEAGLVLYCTVFFFLAESHMNKCNVLELNFCYILSWKLSASLCGFVLFIKVKVNDSICICGKKKPE